MGYIRGCELCCCGHFGAREEAGGYGGGGEWNECVYLQLVVEVCLGDIK